MVMRMEKYFDSASNEQTIQIGQTLGKFLKPGDVVLLIGDLSAGKTTITKGIGQAIGVKKIINSPTFTIVKEYRGKFPLYHLDLYRLDGLNQDFDLEEYIEGDGLCVIEWPYQVKEILPKEYLEIFLERLDQNNRRIKISSHGKRYDEVIEKL